MRLAASNIAWPSADDDAVARLLRANGFTGVELAPTKWRDDPFDAPAHEVAAFARSWRERGLEIVSLQSLLFGHPELQLFGGAASRAALADLLRKVLDFAAAVGARAVVFGSPRNRLRGDLELDRAMEIAGDFLRALGDHAQARDVAFCVEANPVGYGCDFITTTGDAVALCTQVSHPAIRVNADLGGMTMAGEDPRRTIEHAGALIGHVHASEPALAPLGGASDHAGAARGLAAIGYHRWVSIEMRAPPDGGSVDALERAVRLVRDAYGSE